MRSLPSASLLDYCNPAMKNDAAFAAMAQALDPALRDILSQIQNNQIICSLWTVPENVVDFLALYHFNTPYYDLTLPLFTKRNLVENTILNYLPFGTASAVRGVLGIAFNYAEVIEWWQDDPTGETVEHDTFRIQIADPLVDPARVSEMVRLILVLKNVRSWFAGISAFNMGSGTQKIGCAAATYKYQVITTR
jgi:phage tail P2-like protein